MATPLYTIPLNAIDGADTSLDTYAGKVLLIVNVASKCGLTPQYEGLEKLYQGYRDQGLEVLGFPANDFAGQEPGSNAEIQEFCRTNFSVDFPMFAKIAVTGDETHPLYRELTAATPATHVKGDEFREKLTGYGMTPNPEPGILWNFEKFVVSRGGEVVARFSPDTAPDDARIVEAIETELAKG
ncbi:glutathione peroxidase [Sphingomonas sp. C3-2]|uniref:glutathione peroxidase n=1 Tax=Sphingomonas sp. C3-2 TaxID=3062169 RepID=UPI00294B7E45|nr:glutathione peroxidase [Sphingomonas sp. C3-2]WOK36529.1 glutathione peroxidase [Sphingomonas sp. C3-2]